jgi:molybdenum cofactor cytidylyltransferase
MLLRTALRAQPTDTIAFTGGGGKTTAMFRLAAELAADGQYVITTTTTRIFAAQIGLAPRHLIAPGLPGDYPEVVEAISTALVESGHVLVTGPVEPGSPKAFGVAPEWIAALRALPGHPAVLIEADGARMRPFKAPADHEPVIPLQTDLVVVVMGADAFGAPLDTERIHRPERVSALVGEPLGVEVTPDLVAKVLTHPAGGLKEVPTAARVMVLINKVESREASQLARSLAGRLLAHDRLEGVILGAVRHEPPALEAWGRVGAVILAAGQSTRMGRTKQLLPWGETTVLGEVVRRLQMSPISQIVVVTGQERSAIEAAAAQAVWPGGPPVTFAHNPHFAASEMAWSLQAGLRALPRHCLAALVALADQPRLNPAVVERLIAAWRETQAAVVAPCFQGRRGHPLLFDRVAWPHLLDLPASANPRDALARLPEPVQVLVDDESVLDDMDTPEAYARAIGSA